MLFNVLKTIYRKKDSHSMEELFENLSHSKRITVHQTRDEDFFDYDEFLKKFYSNFTGKIKPNHIFSIDENSWAATKQRVKNRFIMTIKECDHQDAKVEKHNCIKSGFEREERLLGTSKLKQALLERKNYIMSRTPKQLISHGLNPYKVISLYKNYRQHVNPKWQDVTCPEPTAEQWKAYQSDTVANTEKRKRKREQKIEVTTKLKKIAFGDDKMEHQNN